MDLFNAHNYLGLLTCMKNGAANHNNGPHQDQIFDNPSALCLAVWTKNQIGGGGGVGQDSLPFLFNRGIFSV